MQGVERPEVGNGEVQRGEAPGLRIPAALRLVLVLSALATFSTALALGLQDRALARDLERAADRRLERSVRAAHRVVESHLEALRERYGTLSGTPQLRANLEVEHAPTLAYHADELRRRELMALLAFLDRRDQVIAASGDPDLLPLALSKESARIANHAGGAYTVTSVDLHSSAGRIGRMVAVDRIAPETLLDWGDLSGASVSFRDSGAHDADEPSRIVRTLDGPDLVVHGSLEAERRALRHSRTNLILAGCVALALSFLASIRLSRGFVRPILAIEQATKRIRRGDLDLRLADQRNDELGDVARAFNLMLDSLRESRAELASHLEELRRSQSHLANAQKLARLGSFELEVATGSVRGSEELHDLFQIENDGKPIPLAALRERIHEEDRSDLDRAARLTLREGLPLVADFRIRLADGGERVMHAEAHPLREEGERVNRIDGTVQDITERRRADEQIRYLAYHDSLTGLGNRLLVAERLGVALAQARRHDTSVGVLFLDLDHFKRINDTLGHTAGDELLRGVADRLASCVRGRDTITRNLTEQTAVSRVGGDEFTVIVSGLQDAHDLSSVARRILDTLERPFRIAGHELVVGASIGIAAWPLDGDDVETLLRNADSAMYHAKKRGRNNYQFYAEAMNAAALTRLEIEEAIRAGLARREFELHYQPKLDLATERVTGFEALVRWQHPERGLVMPSDFLTVAEQTGLVVALGEYVLRAACRQLAAWQADDGREPSFDRLAVNLSPQQFRGGDLVGLVTQVLQETGARPERLELEITERSLMHDEEAVIEQLQRLRATGVAISLDDFGTGYSSLSFVRRLPVDTLKIDRSFVVNIAENPEDAALAAAIVAMGKARGLRVVAEGVESEEQRELLRAWGCDEIQGFLISPAVPAEEASRWRGALFDARARTPVLAS